MVTVKQIENGLAKYLDEYFLPNLPDEGAKKIFIAAAATMFVRRIGNVVEQYKTSPALQMFGLVEDDKIDIEAFTEELLRQMGNDGFHLELLGLNMKIFKSDIVKLKKCICKGEMLDE